MGHVASLGLTFSAVFPNLFPFISVGVGLQWRPLALLSSPPPYRSPFWGGGCEAGAHGLLEIIKIYASVCKHTFKSWRFPSAGIFKLQS